VIKVLVVDDSALMRKVVGNILAAAGDLDVAFARDGAEALERLPLFRPDVVTLDVQMPRMNGLECLRRIMVEWPCRVVMVSALTESDANLAVEAIALGAVDVLAKPKGAISLSVDAFGPALAQRVRDAAATQLRPTRNLTERVRLRARGGGPRAPAGLPTEPDRLPAPAPRERSAPARSAPAGRIVLIGCSTGGPPALDAVLSALPASFPWPVVVAQHMPAFFTASLARRLDRLCALAVVEVTAPMPLEAGTVYIGKGEADLLVGMRQAGLVVMPAPRSPDHRWHPSVDRLVASAMQHIDPARLIGVLMTGMGNDGAETMTALLAAGGHTIAEAEETAVVWGMPGELVRAGGAEAIIPLHQIGQSLLDLAG
jgi:two-component system chemotaxis response regulator CheB